MVRREELRARPLFTRGDAGEVMDRWWDEKFQRKLKGTAETLELPNRPRFYPLFQNVPVPEEFVAVRSEGQRARIGLLQRVERPPLRLVAWGLSGAGLRRHLLSTFWTQLIPHGENGSTYSLRRVAIFLPSLAWWRKQRWRPEVGGSQVQLRPV